jgi:SAM-dependent methyltransferase
LNEVSFHHALSLLKQSFEGDNEVTVFVNAIVDRVRSRTISLLDVGVGAGNSTLECLKVLGSLGIEVNATFVGPEVPSDRREVLKAAGELVDLKFEEYHTDARFDVVMITQTLYYLPDLRKAIEKLIACVKPGGLLLITTWSRVCVLYRLYDVVCRGPRPSYAAEDVRQMVFEATGEIPAIVYSRGSVKLSMWRDDDAMRAACYMVISRSHEVSSDNNAGAFWRAICALGNEEERVNGTLIVAL